MQQQAKIDKLSLELASKNSKIEKLMKQLAVKPSIKEVEKVVTVEKKVEVPIYIDRPITEHIHHPPPPQEIITKIKTVEVPVVIEQTPLVDQVVKTTVYEKEDQGVIRSLQNEMACLKEVIGHLEQARRCLLNDNQGLHSQLSSLQGMADSRLIIDYLRLWQNAERLPTAGESEQRAARLAQPE